ncbi:MAG TPA: glycosyltransferase [Streptosporangiaceae bacterium]|nr:glycosyltransferase [Streptosporangiaceae bacterium]
MTAFLMLKLGVLTFNMIGFPVLRRRSADEQRPAVSLLVPMRNEAARLAASVPAMLAQDADEIILLDDESTDETGALAWSLLSGHPRARVVDGVPAPPGWVGKSWACHQLAAAASGSLLVFCDADVLLAEGAIDAVIAEMQAQRADVFSVFSRQITGSLGEHLITPLIDDVLLCFLPFALLSADVPRAATASGALLVFTRPAYEQLGGFAAVRGEITEDVMIARRTRQAGLKLGLALGGQQVATRMYRGYREVLTGMSRGLLPVTGGSRTRLALGAGWHLLVYTLPWALAPRRRRWLVPLVLGVAERALVEIKTERQRVWQALLTPLSPVAAMPIVARSLRGHQRWKERTYP